MAGAKQYGHRIACLIGAVFLTGSLAGLAWGVKHGYPAIAAAMVALTIGLRIVMTILRGRAASTRCPATTLNGAALNDTTPGVGTTIGTALVGALDCRPGHPRGCPRAVWSRTSSHLVLPR